MPAPFWANPGVPATKGPTSPVRRFTENFLPGNLAVIGFSSATTDGADVTSTVINPIVAWSSATTDGTDITATNIGPIVGFSSGTTDSADISAVTVDPVVGLSSASTDGADTASASVSPIVGLSSATTDGADVTGASVSIIVGVTSAQTDGADISASAADVIVAGTSATNDGADAANAAIDVGGNAIAFSSDTTDGADSMSAQVVPQLRLVSVTDGDERVRRKYKAKNKKRREDIEAAFEALVSHHEPSVVAEAKEIAQPALVAGELVIERLPEFRAEQLMALYREIEEEELLLLIA